MPATGRKQKPAGQAVNRHATLEWTEVPNVLFTGGPALSAKMPDGKPWPDRIRSRWEIYSSMPHCKLWTASDWRFAVDTLIIATRFEENYDCRVAAELRNREKIMGTTLDFRRDIRVRYVEPKQGDETAQVANLDDYRSL
jgi:hypothetical protein